MTGKIKLYVGLLVLGVALMGGGVWFLVNAPPAIDIPESPPVIVMDIDRIMAGEFSNLYIYEGGSIIYVEEKNLRMPTREYPPTRIWELGKLQEEELNSLLEFVKDSGFDKLDEYYQFPGKPHEGGGFSMGDMSFTITINSENLSKTVTAFGYLTPDHGLTYPDMPYPLNELYQELKNIAENSTEEIHRETIKD